jgi:peptidoglycan/LPS O-acetylase OafA/YrhL
MPPHIRSDIQILRGIALLAVFLYHAAESYFPLGYLGVDAFFVISGYVMTPTILRLCSSSKLRVLLKSLTDFYKKRFFRLAPAFATTMVISAFLLFLLQDTRLHKLFSHQGISASLLVGNLGANRYSGNYFTPNNNPLIHTWSLSVEAQIYIFIPLIILVLNFMLQGKNKFLLIYILLTSISFVLFMLPSVTSGIYAKIGFIKDPSLFNYYSPIERFWQFGIGGLLVISKIRTKIFDKRSSKVVLISFFANLVYVLYLFSKFRIELRIDSLIICLLTLLIILTRSPKSIPNFLANKLVWLGDRSYSIYLVHLPLISIARTSPLINFDSRVIQIIFALTLSILIGSLNYKYIEQRFRINTRDGFERTIHLQDMLYFFLPPIVVFGLISTGQSLNIFKDPNLPSPPRTMSYEWDPRCRVMQRENFTSRYPCVYNIKEKNNTILVIGDSHAASISKTVVRIGKILNHSVAVFTHASCPFVVDNSKIRVNGSCVNHNNRILEYIKNNSPDVILYTNASSATYKSSFDNFIGNSFNSQIITDLKKISNINNSLIFLGLTPEYRHVPTVIELILGKKGSFDPIPAQDNEFFKSFTNDSAYNYLEIYPMFCNSFNCNNRTQGLWLFDDNSHLSQGGGRYLEELIRSEVDKLLKN